MSDSSLSSVTPSQAALERALRNAVERVYKLGNLEELTVKRIRAAAEQDLDLEEGFFKTDSTWKEKSKDIIQSEVVRINKCPLLNNFNANSKFRNCMHMPTRSVIPHCRKARPDLRRQRDYQKHRKQGNRDPKERNVHPPLKSDRRRGGRRRTQMKKPLLLMMLARKRLVLLRKPGNVRCRPAVLL